LRSVTHAEWFHCAQGGFPLSAATYRVAADPERGLVITVAVDGLGQLQPLTGRDALRFLDVVDKCGSHIRWSCGGVPRAAARYRLLRANHTGYAIVLAAYGVQTLLSGEDAAQALRDIGVLRVCDGAECRGREALVFEPGVSICDRCGYRAEDAVDAHRIGDLLTQGQ
jgi:hypothetical protein